MLYTCCRHKKVPFTVLKLVFMRFAMQTNMNNLRINDSVFCGNTFENYQKIKMHFSSAIVQEPILFDYCSILFGNIKFKLYPSFCNKPTIYNLNYYSKLYVCGSPHPVCACNWLFQYDKIQLIMNRNAPNVGDLFIHGVKTLKKWFDLWMKVQTYMVLDNGFIQFLQDVILLLI